jgi:mannosyltransferase OCH1-like enzyme
LAASIANAKPVRHLGHTTIPRIVHQAWKSTDIKSFPRPSLPAVETWLDYATDPNLPSTAYFMWDDEGMLELMEAVETETLPYYEALLKPVEKADIFRVVVCNSIGGVYGDIDTTPLRPPTGWVEAKDVAPWSDTRNDRKFAIKTESQEPVALILGIEADTPEHSDSHWRMGYTYPVQLTQWALAGSSKHPVLERFLQNFRVTMRDAMEDSAAEGDLLRQLDVLELTGPAAITRATMDYYAETIDLRWQALSGLDNGGLSKLVQDTLILPITAFSPGRGTYGNMGSRPYTDPDARLRHDAQGSWRKFDLVVELGKTCRTILGLCREWPKTSG